ncbi:MAG: transcription termination/antitermination protein NusG [Bryobacteraceae bacterium]
MADQNFDDEQAVHTLPEEELGSTDGDEQSIEADADVSDAGLSNKESDSTSDNGVHGLEHETELANPPHDQADGPFKNWYIIHAYSGFEQKVAESLRSRAQAFGFAGRLGQILIPTEEVIELRAGKKVISKRLLYPGYVLVEMEMDDELWHAVKSTPRVTGFVGGGTKPVPLTADEVNSVLYRQAASADRPRPKMSFEKSETVKIIDGPFTNFSGKVDEVNTDRNTLRVMVTIFGRSTPVELDFLQVEKM